jgi:ParB family chromosome partitioning protein
MGKKALGRGLDALFEQNGGEGTGELAVPLIAIDRIVPGRHQPRKSFDDERIEELADSIREHGLIQPIVVAQRGDRYEIVVGERRYRAAKIAGLKEIPSFIKDLSESGALELALIENIQRQDLNPIEEATAYRLIVEREHLTQEELSKRIGKSRSYIANMIRLLDLPDGVRDYVSRGTLSVGQAKAVLSLPNDAEREALAERIVEQGYTVREVEHLTKKRHVPRGTSKQGKDPHIEELEERLRSRLGTKVAIDYHGGKGRIKIEFYGEDDLERILGELLVESGGSAGI